MRLVARIFILGFFSVLPTLSLFAQEPSPSESPVNSVFRDQFYLDPSQKIHFNTTQAGEFLVVERPSPEWNSNVALVGGFASQALRTRALKDIQSVDQAKEWIQAQKKTTTFEGVPIHQLTIPLPDGSAKDAFWVGNKSFDSFDEAAGEIAMIKSVIETQGGDFVRAVELAEEFVEPEPAPPGPEVKTPAQFKQEEEIAFRWADQLDIGEELWGPFHGEPAGEPILYQSFGESTWRSTNLAEREFQSQVGFWTNRLVFKGIRFPLSTLDPYVEVTAAMESSPNDGGNQLDTVAGLEWRPLVRNAWLENFRPWGGIPLLIWAKNYRFYIQYMDRRNLKDEIANIRDFDFRAGVDIFYEWGIELSPIDQAPGKGFVGFLTDYTWGEYFGNYGWRDTNFTANENFDAFILDSSLILGLKTPPVNLPPNPINEHLILMPYFRFALIANTRLSNPTDNRYYVSVGVRWMPFRSYRFVNNEWLLKTKIFAEWLAIGKVQNLKQDDSRPHPDEDWRIGIAWSLRRF